jgi:hypothetical protein
MLMNKCTKEIGFIKGESTWSVLEQVARQGAQKMLQLALENEVEEFIQKHSSLKDENGKKVVTKNGYCLYLKTRSLLMENLLRRWLHNDYLEGM